MVSVRLALSALQLSSLASASMNRRQNGPIPSGTIKDCTYFATAQKGDTCASIAHGWGITPAQFLQYNPSVKSDCSGLVVGDSYCVEENHGNGPQPTSTSSKPPTGTPTNAPSPTQTGIAQNCQRYYMVQSGDTCAGIVDNYHTFTLSDFYSWNPAVGSNCEKLLAGYYVCVGVPGTPTTPVTSPTSKATGTGPSPTQTGINKDCTKYYKAVAGDTCDVIASSYGISTPTFETWNPAVGSDCTHLLAGYYYCVAISGSTPSPTTKKTTASPTPTGPSPTQSGIAKDCTKFYKAVSGDTCDAISTKFGTFTVAQFEKWNPAVGSDCAKLLAGYYYCIAVPGTPTVKTTATTAKKTSSGPEPEQTGISKDCNKYYKVASGDTCDNISKKYGITLAKFYSYNKAIKSDCSNLLAGYYVCVGVKA